MFGGVGVVLIWNFGRGGRKIGSETAGEEYNPPLDHLSGPRSNQGGRRPGGECAGGLGAAPTSAKACVGSELVRVRVQKWGTGDAGRPKTHVRGATPGELTS